MPLCRLQNSNEVLSMFDHYKVDDTNRRRRRVSAGDGEPARKMAKRDSTSSTADIDDKYFAKYLTGPKLLQLQLNDSQFRRYVLTQFLITCQWLAAGSKFA